MSGSLQDAVDALREEVAKLEPARLDGDRARELVEEFAEAERLCAAGKTLALRQVVATQSWKRAGAFRSAGAWLARVVRSTIGNANATVDTAQRLESLPDTEAAMRAGLLSGVQVEAIADAATDDPSAERELLVLASRDGVRGLRDECARVKAAACRDEPARDAKVRAARSLRNWTDPDGTGRIAIRGPIVDVALIMARLEPFERAIFAAARTADVRGCAEMFAFDAMLAMASASLGRGAGDESGPNLSPHVGVVRIDHEALVRGHTVPGEVCELAGAGPIPVYEASRMLEDAFLKAVVVRGTDVVVVSHLGRAIPAHVRTAVEEIYQECCIEGCHQRRHLEIDHNAPIEVGGRTELRNLSRLCTFHHRYKHRNNLRLTGEGARKRFVRLGDLPPPDPRDPPDPPDQRGREPASGVEPAVLPLMVHEMAGSGAR